MASTLLYIKSKGLLPTFEEDEDEITEEELLRRLVEYKSYKRNCKNFKKKIIIFYSRRFFKLPDTITLPKQALEKEYDKEILVKAYEDLRIRNEVKINLNSKRKYGKNSYKRECNNR